jgi:hypothetical protein
MFEERPLRAEDLVSRTTHIMNGLGHPRLNLSFLAAADDGSLRARHKTESSELSGIWG